MANAKVESWRMDPELSARLRRTAEEKGQSFSDVMREAVLSYLGDCPTCGQQIPAAASRAEG